MGVCIVNELTLVIADGHHLMREGLRLLLEARLACRVVGEATTGPEALKLVEEQRPDILIIDLSLAEVHAVEVTQTLRTQGYATRVMILTLDASEADVRAALRAGAMAFVLSDSPTNDFLYAVGQVAAGQHYLSPRLAERAFNAFAHPDPGAAPTARLSLREQEVLSLVAQGMTSAAIASRLGIGGRTVEWHRARLQQKLGLRNVADLVRYALQHKLIIEDSGPPDTRTSGLHSAGG
jgi:two-component system response regulator NreC